MKKVHFLALFIAGIMVPGLVSAQQTGANSAEEIRQKAIDFATPSYFPSEWESAERQYTQGAYDAAANAFESLFKKTIPLYAQAREDEIMAARGELIVAGIRNAEPEYFALADKTALTALDLYEAEDYYPARDSAVNALKMYQTLGSAYTALLVREEIHEREFEAYDPETYYDAGELLNTAMDEYEEGNISQANEKAEESLQKYNQVLIAGWAVYAELRSSLADAERQAAVDMKADIATRDLFAEADSVYGAGVESFDSESYREAAHQFINSEALFITASTAATEKRRNAAETIREASERIAESDENARQVESIIEGGAK